ncbi:phosphatidylethanolamine N-methyltransferase isoform X2 [Kryptolebias marmoratus]|uniref:Phosphatidylethanolamine N-methyltransferase n=1 Tax=Kryptolebias marmoratus TaxID=37003 RepID=A0A3Q2ZCX9_KRYMA|nr:phosphatidylethanolamine N-methyltransferase isoform X2 [Kryptolebias marmoratus]
MRGSDAAAAQNKHPAENNPPGLLDCCGGLGNVDYSKMDLTLVEGFLRHINFHDSSFCIAVIAIIFNPFFWNVVARWEHHTRGLSRLFGSPYLACYSLGFVIILLNVFRSHRCSSSSRSSFHLFGLISCFLFIRAHSSACASVTPTCATVSAPIGRAYSHTSLFWIKMMTKHPQYNHKYTVHHCTTFLFCLFFFKSVREMSVAEKQFLKPAACYNFCAHKGNYQHSVEHTEVKYRRI